MQSFPYHLRDEGRALWSRVGIGRPDGYRILLIHLALVGVFGVFLPWTKGLEFLDSVITSAYACLGVLFAAPAAAQAFAADRPGTMAGAMARILMAVLYGECMAAAILLAGFVTVYLTRLGRVIFAPDIETLAFAVALGMAASLALATAAASITLLFSANAARNALRILFLLLLVIFYYRSGWLPDVAGRAALACLAVAAAEIFAVRFALRRGK